MPLRALVALIAAPAVAIDNGLGRTPPMGWRSWNLYGDSVNQSVMMGIMDGMVSKKRMVDGVPTSLLDLGYSDVGLDDAWQKCVDKKYHFHDGAGVPVVNMERFPDMIAMTSHAHKLGLTAGWYANNCICAEKAPATLQMYQSDVAALTVFNFDAVKLDGCGTQMDLDLWSGLLNATGRPVMIENCHWGNTVPNATWCPWNFFRTSGDVRASYGSVVANLQTTVQWADKGLSRPGCWGYPDMLEVGCQHGPGGADDPGLSMAETRSHFGAWAIVSVRPASGVRSTAHQSPLTLSHDVNNDTVMDLIWPIISNREVIAVNQAWAGHSGSPFKQSGDSVMLEAMVKEKGLAARAGAAASWQFFRKPVGGGKVAVLLMNHADKAQNLTVSFSEVPGLECTSCRVRDLWARKDLGTMRGAYTAQGLASHDSALLMLEPEATIIF